MSWVRVDDKIARHPKFLRAGKLIGRDGPAIALGLFVWGLTYSAEFLSDGFLPHEAVDQCGLSTRPRRVAQGLVGAGLWETAEGGYRIHDYTDYQPTADEVSERREQRRQAGRRGGRRSGESRRSETEANPRSNTEANLKRDASVLLQPCRSDSLQGGFDIAEANANPIPKPIVRSPSESKEHSPTESVQSRAREASPASPPDPDALRAGEFVRWYEAQYRHLRAAHYLRRPVIDFDHALRLCRTYPDDDWLRKLAEFYLACDHADARRVSRTIGQFAHLSGWVDQELRARGLRPASDPATPGTHARGAPTEAVAAWRERLRLTLDGNAARYVLEGVGDQQDDGQTLTVRVDPTVRAYLARNHLVDTLTEAARDVGRALTLDTGESADASSQPPAA